MEPTVHINRFLKNVKKLRGQAQALHGAYILLAYVMGSSFIACLLASTYQEAIKWIWPAMGLFLAGLIFIMWRIIRILFKPFSQDDAALLADSRYPKLNNALINSSQLARQLNQPPKKNISTTEFIEELHRQTSSAISKINPSTTINKDGIAFSRNCFLAALTLLIFATTIEPSFIKNGFKYWANNQTLVETSKLHTTKNKQTSSKVITTNFSIESLVLTFNFPSYTGIKTRLLKSLDGEIHVLPGTEVNILAKTNSPISGADLVFNGTENLSMNGENSTTIMGNLLVKEKGFYQFKVKDLKNTKHLLKNKYPITLDKDQPPNIVLFLANPKPTYYDTDKVQMFYEGKDEFGITSVELIALVNGTIKRIPVKSFKTTKKDVKDSFTWVLPEMEFKPGDRVQYYLEIKDNDNVFGPNTGQSEAYSFTIFDSSKEMENLIVMQEKMIEQMIALLATGLVQGASLNNKSGNILGWKQLFTASVDDLIEIVNLAQRIHDKGQSIEQFPQSHLNLLKNIIRGLSQIRHSQIIALDDIQDQTYKPTQARYETKSNFSSINKQMTEHLEKDILFLIKKTNEQKLNKAIGLEKELNQLTQTLREEFEKIKNRTSPKNSSSIKNKLKKIRQTLQKIMNQLNRQTKSMPDEFLNSSAFKQLDMKSFSTALDKMQNMINQGNLDKALKELEKMTKDLQILANQLDQASNREQSFLDPKTIDILNDTNTKINTLKDKQQKIIEQTTKINQQVRKEQSKQFESKLNDLFDSLLQDVSAIQKLFRDNENFLKEHVSIKQLEKFLEEEKEISEKIEVMRKTVADTSDEEVRNQSFIKLNEVRKDLSRLSQEKDSLNLNEIQRFKEALPKLIKKYDSLNEIAKSSELNEFANYFKQTYPDVLRWQNNLRSASNLRKDLSDRMNKDMTHATKLNNNISKKLGSMIHSIRKSYNSSITQIQKNELNAMAKQEHQMREATEKLSQQLHKLNKENPMIPPELAQRMDQTSRHMKRAEKNLNRQSVKESIEAENQALKGLNDTSEMLKQMSNPNGKPGKARRQTPRKLGMGSSRDSNRGGMQRMQKERVLLPTEDQYHAPKEFRQEILSAMKKQTPKDYRRMVMEYYKNLVQ